MGSSSRRLFNRQRTLHDILGGGFLADVILWRQENLTLGIILVTLAVWIVFERSGYTLLSLVSSVLLLLTTILFLWAKSAAVLRRPAPPLPKLHISEETADYLAAHLRSQVNIVLSAFEDISLGRNSLLYYKVAAWLLLISVVGGLTDFLTLGYISLFLILTVPSLYERYEDHVDKYVWIGYCNLQRLYAKLDEEWFSRVNKWILEIQKLS